MIEQVNMDGLISYLIELLGQRFAAEVSQLYYGDIGIYPPSAFLGPRREQKCVVAISPDYNRLVENDRNAAFESRLLGVNVIVMVNLTPYFEAMPKEAIGERKLVQVTTAIAEYLTLEENINLKGRVQFTKVGDIDWEWQARGTQAVRAAAISHESRVRIPRI